VPHPHPVNDPCQAEESTGNEREQIQGRVETVDRLFVRHVSQLQQLAAMQENGVNLGEQGDDVERQATALNNIEEECPGNLSTHQSSSDI